LMGCTIEEDGTLYSDGHVTDQAVSLSGAISLASGDPGIFAAWQNQDNSVAGHIGSSLGSYYGDIDEIPINQWNPNIVPLGQEALLLTEVGNGMVGTVWARRVLDSGDVKGDAFQVTDSSASGTVASWCTPFWACYAYVDIVSINDPGIHVGLVAPRCDDGMVLCTEGQEPAVCTAVGTTGYTALPGAIGWCSSGRGGR